jgi:hypothetical protein
MPIPSIHRKHPWRSGQGSSLWLWLSKFKPNATTNSFFVSRVIFHRYFFRAKIQIGIPERIPFRNQFLRDFREYHILFVAARMYLTWKLLIGLIYKKVSILNINFPMICGSVVRVKFSQQVLAGERMLSRSSSGYHQLRVLQLLFLPKNRDIFRHSYHILWGMMCCPLEQPFL